MYHVRKSDGEKPFYEKSVFLPVLLVTVLLTGAYAWALANVYTSQEAESGTRTGNVTVVSDATASSSGALKFGEASVVTCPTTKRVITASDVTNRTNSSRHNPDGLYRPMYHHDRYNHR